MKHEASFFSVSYCRIGISGCPPSPCLQHQKHQKLHLHYQSTSRSKWTALPTDDLLQVPVQPWLSLHNLIDTSVRTIFIVHSLKECDQRQRVLEQWVRTQSWLLLRRVPPPIPRFFLRVGGRSERLTSGFRLRWHAFSKHGIWILMALLQKRNWLLSSA